MLSFTMVYFIHWGGSGLSLQLGIPDRHPLLVPRDRADGVDRGEEDFKQVGPPEKAIEQGKEIPKALRGKA